MSAIKIVTCLLGAMMLTGCAGGDDGEQEGTDVAALGGGGGSGGTGGGGGAGPGFAELQQTVHVPHTLALIRIVFHKARGQAADVRADWIAWDKSGGYSRYVSGGTCTLSPIGKDETFGSRDCWITAHNVNDLEVKVTASGLDSMRVKSIE